MFYKFLIYHCDKLIPINVSTEIVFEIHVVENDRVYTTNVEVVEITHYEW